MCHSWYQFDWVRFRASSKIVPTFPYSSIRNAGHIRAHCIWKTFLTISGFHKESRERIRVCRGTTKIHYSFFFLLTNSLLNMKIGCPHASFCWLPFSRDMNKVADGPENWLHGVYYMYQCLQARMNVEWLSATSQALPWSISNCIFHVFNAVYTCAVKPRWLLISKIWRPAINIYIHEHVCMKEKYLPFLLYLLLLALYNIFSARHSQTKYDWCGHIWPNKSLLKSCDRSHGMPFRHVGTHADGSRQKDSFAHTHEFTRSPILVHITAR